jgi:hypothetical protein
MAGVLAGRVGGAMFSSLNRRLGIWQTGRTTGRLLAGRMERVPAFRFEPVADGLGLHDIRIRRDRGGYLVQALEPGLHHIRINSACWIYWMHHAPQAVRDIACDCSDGNDPSLAPFVFSSPDAARVLMPDAYFFRLHAYRDTRKFADDNPVAWSGRSDDIIWRGYPNGGGLFTLDPAMQTHPVVNHRMRMAYKVQQGQTGIDFRFVAGRRPKNDPFLRANGFIGERIPSESWIGRKFAIDIDGFSNTWDNLFVRMHQGCCVLKVASNLGFRQWYYDKLEPYRNYVPIKADLSDLESQIDWVRSHDAEAREIAAEGRALVRSMTWESERAVAAARIEEFWQRG